MAKEFKISTLRLKELEQELFYLKTTREKEVAELQAELQEERNFSFQQRAHISALESRCRKAEKLLEMLPAEELKKFLSSQRVRLR